MGQDRPEPAELFLCIEHTYGAQCEDIFLYGLTGGSGATTAGYLNVMCFAAPAPTISIGPGEELHTKLYACNREHESHLYCICMMYMHRHALEMLH